jgi:hypothetical protein
MLQKLILLISLFLSFLSYSQSADLETQINRFQKAIESDANDSIKIEALKAWNRLICLIQSQI